MNIFEEVESNVRSYCRSFPDTFLSAKGSIIKAASGKPYIDFFAGAGALNYGHNHEHIKRRLIEYIESDGIIHSLDMYTVAKEQFLHSFRLTTLNKLNYPYKVQFCGPTGTNAVEAAIKLARKVTKRAGIFAFMGSFHGMSLGSLSITSNNYHRQAAGIPLSNVTFIPYPGDIYDINSIDYIEKILQDDHSGVDKPAAIVVETIQAEGGINIAPIDWLQALSEICKKHEILLICDEVQVGCGRTGSFFSFEEAGIVPDLVILSKSISGYGLPMALLLIKEQYDIWAPGEHNGTFRGNQLAFVAATAALELWDSKQFQEVARENSSLIKTVFEKKFVTLDPEIQVRGKGMIWGIDFSGIPIKEIAYEVRDICFSNGLIVECVGRKDTVVKILPPLTIEQGVLRQGLEILADSIKMALKRVVAHKRG
ncbi:diaminobutyrate--2-oxoglutarate transaminase [Paenibacillus paeoniae]|uniref:Diaminobutyrate--2-oxoglutarate transaminase n=1 Tax=Paenibacillus paeoniae TaxID=2292705 RepID=A0A371P885_9BACL|nr:diaminobutyrate--2-oxoglutarate transaminase [Paenibacillus paeoniae]REK71686.1 diaminobutyrate--2-oxoglutarate transaminase [Paenibacillus paeoniae]